MALVADGPDKGKLCVIVDVINQRSVSCLLVNVLYSGYVMLGALLIKSSASQVSQFVVIGFASWKRWCALIRKGSLA